MSLPGLSNQNAPQGIPTEKPKSDVYTVIVLIARNLPSPPRSPRRDA